MKLKSFIWSYLSVLCSDLFLSAAYADNCGSLSDCWNTLTAAAVTAAAAAAAAALAVGLAFKEKGQKVGDYMANNIEELREWYEDYIAEYMDKKSGRGLTDQEHRFGAWNPIDTKKISENSEIAKKITEKNFPDLESLRNNVADAFRHFVWTATNSRDIGVDQARKYAIAHEMYKDNFEKTRDEFVMDTWNNAQGLDYIQNLPSEFKPTLEDIINEARQRIKDGRLRWLK